MKLGNVKEVKSWLRSIQHVKKELELKIDFYKGLCGDFNNTAGFEGHVIRYKEEIRRLTERLNRVIHDTERIFNILDDSERMILTARYINLIRWDYIEFKVFYSRRQAIRLHDTAVKKLVGQEVSDG